jgi:hypothetical protein
MRSGLSSNTRYVAFAVLLAGCQGENLLEGETDLQGGGELELSEYQVTDPLPTGSMITICNTTQGVNHRSGPGTNYLVLRVLKPGSMAMVTSYSKGWYKIEVDEQSGWVFGTFVCLAEEDPSVTSSPAQISREHIIQNAASLVGFSYWWGNARFKVGSKDYGKCLSSTTAGHTGMYGADCSGFVSKVWELPEAMPWEANLHPFSTWNFYAENQHWKAISRNTMLKADTLVYRGLESGHIVVYESGDVWGSLWTYEARGCSFGIVHNLRTLGSSFAARQRDGC